MEVVSCPDSGLTGDYGQVNISAHSFYGIITTILFAGKIIMLDI